VVTPENQTDHSDDAKNTPAQGGFWGAIKSVSAAFLGVQSKKNWEKDSQAPSPLRFIFAGLVMGLVFFGTVFAITYVIASYIV